MLRQKLFITLAWVMWIMAGICGGVASLIAGGGAATLIFLTIFCAMTAGILALLSDS